MSPELVRERRCGVFCTRAGQALVSQAELPRGLEQTVGGRCEFAQRGAEFAGTGRSSPESPRTSPPPRRMTARRRWRSRSRSTHAVDALGDAGDRVADLGKRHRAAREAPRCCRRQAARPAAQARQPGRSPAGSAYTKYSTQLNEGTTQPRRGGHSPVRTASMAGLERRHAPRCRQRCAARSGRRSEASDRRCGICALPVGAEEPTAIDHIVPFSLGGGDEAENLRIVHARCNTRRGAWYADPRHRSPACGSPWSLRTRAPHPPLAAGTASSPPGVMSMYPAFPHSASAPRTAPGPTSTPCSPATAFQKRCWSGCRTNVSRTRAPQAPETRRPCKFPRHTAPRPLRAYRLCRLQHVFWCPMPNTAFPSLRDHRVHLLQPVRCCPMPDTAIPGFRKCARTASPAPRLPLTPFPREAPPPLRNLHRREKNTPAGSTTTRPGESNASIVLPASASTAR